MTSKRENIKSNQIITELESLIYNLRVLQRLLNASPDAPEIETIRDNINYCFNRLDDLGVNFNIQNNCIYLAQNTKKDIKDIVKDVLALGDR